MCSQAGKSGLWTPVLLERVAWHRCCGSGPHGRNRPSRPGTRGLWAGSREEKEKKNHEETTSLLAWPTSGSADNVACPKEAFSSVHHLTPPSSRDTERGTRASSSPPPPRLLASKLCLSHLSQALAGSGCDSIPVSPHFLRPDSATHHQAPLQQSSATAVLRDKAATAALRLPECPVQRCSQVIRLTRLIWLAATDWQALATPLPPLGPPGVGTLGWAGRGVGWARGKQTNKRRDPRLLILCSRGEQAFV